MTVGSQQLLIRKLAAAELRQRQMQRRRAASKYQEILNVLNNLEVGEAILIPRGKISEDGLRAQARKLSDRTFASHLDDNYLTVIRSR